MSFLDPFRSWILSAARIVLGLLLVEHGTIKHFGFPDHPLNDTPLLSLTGIAGIFELVFGALLVLGLFARFSAFILSGLCASAYFLIYAPNGFYPFLNGGESAVTYCFALLVLAAYGPGILSLDTLRKRG